MNFESKEKSGSNSHLGSVSRTAGWISWHLAATLTIGLGTAIIGGAGFTLGRTLLPAGLLAVGYLTLSLLIVPSAGNRRWLFGIWLLIATVGQVGIYFVLDRIDLAPPIVFFSLASVVVALAALVPYVFGISRIFLVLLLGVGSGAAVLIRPEAGRQKMAEITALASALYPLSLRRYTTLVAPPDADGGALAVLPEGLLLAGGDGVFQWLAGTGGLDGRVAVRAEIPPPEDRVAYLADFDDPKAAPRLRLTDVIFGPGDRPARLYAAHQAWNSAGRCYTMRISEIAVDWAADGAPRATAEWSTLFETEPCQTASGLFDDSETGGRLAWDKDSGLLVTLGDLGFNGFDGDVPFAQLETGNSYGKIWRIDSESGAATLVSIGHRNPQGITVARDGRIWESEHGPQGGDEINFIQDGGNYGWPLVTYGTKYGSTGWPLDPDGCDHGEFDEPALSFVPSVATSALIELTGPMFPRWNGDLMLASLRAQSLYRLRVQSDRIVYSEPIGLGDRLRDIVELPDGRIVAWVDTGVLLELSLDVRDSAFNRFCVGCHAPQFGAAAGPDLSNVVGRRIASLPGFDYSIALKIADGAWNEAALDEFLRDPQAFAPGTSMVIPGLDEASRAEVVRYLMDN